MTWPMVELQDCCSVVGGATPKRNVEEYWSSSDIPWITPKDISGLDRPVLSDAPEYISKAGFDSCATYMLPKGSILLTSRAPIGNVAIAGREMCTNQGFKSLIPGPDVDSTYLYYCIQKNAIRLDNLGNGATFKEVSKKVVERFEIPLPPLKEQKRIAAILDKADKLRRKRQQAIQLADEFLRSVFLDMFGDLIINRYGWNVAPLGESLEFLTSGSRGWAKYYADEGAPFIRIQNVSKGRLLLEDMAFVDPPKGAEADRTRVKVGDVLLSITADLGRSAVVSEAIAGGHINQHLALLRPNLNKVHPRYLASCLSSSSGVRQFAAMNKSAVKAGLNFNDIRTFQLPLPPMELQKKYTEVYDKTFRALEVNNTSNECLDNLFHSISQRAFSGNL